VTAAPKITVFVSFSGEGGVERMVSNLVQGFAAEGVNVDLLLIKAKGPHLAEFPPTVRVFHLDAPTTLLALPALVRYLRRERPPVLLAAKDRAGRVALLARRLARVRTRVVIRLGTTLSAALEGRSGLQRWLRYRPIRWLYPSADAIVAVSEGVAADTVAISGIDPVRVQVVRNPVIAPEFLARAESDPGHPWFTGRGRPPVIVAAGRLTRQKDFPTLIEAFARLRAARPCRLIILGEGRQRAELKDLAARLGVSGDMTLPGFAADLPAWLARADLFVLSSAWEGSPNVLTEALALGVPVVATDCPSGPREILAGGHYGPLVPVGDAAALARAMGEVLDHPLPAATLREAAAPYNRAQSARGYLRVLGLLPDGVE
jgi:glycosyltransferase involved in cell wall biosynthesis